MDKETSFYILSKPYAISFKCPHCNHTQEIKWSDLDAPEYWGDSWGEVECPECGETEHWEIGNMTDQQMERLKDACVIMGESLITTLQAARAALDVFAANSLDFTPDPVLEEKERDPFEALMRAVDEVGGAIDQERLQELAQMAEDMPPIVRKKMPRPPKRIGPVNRTNYTANRPPRRARSSCRVMNRR